MDITLKNIPHNVKIFFARGLAIFVVWKLLYLLALQPLHFPDEPLTRLILFLTTKVLSLVFTGTYFIGHQVVANGMNIIRIGTPCNGLELMVLYCGFIIAMPSPVNSYRRKSLYMLGGIAGLVVFNVIRCFLLAVISTSYPQIFEFSHKYAFNIMAYSSMIWAWSYYCKNKKYVL